MMVTMLSVLFVASPLQVDGGVGQNDWSLSVRAGGGYSAPVTERADSLSGAGRGVVDLTVALSVLDLGPLTLDVETQVVQGLPSDESALELMLRELRLRAVLRAPEVFWRPLSVYGGIGATGAWMRLRSTLSGAAGNEWVPGGLALAGVRLDAQPRKNRGLFAYGEYGYALRAERILRLEPEDAEPVAVGRLDFSGHVVSVGVGVRF